MDTNTIAYLYLPTQYTADVEALLDADAEWTAPNLWRSEFGNLLALYIRKQIIALDTALAIQAEAEKQLDDDEDDDEYAVNSTAVLLLAESSGCSSYDREFIAVAKALNIKLITEDKKLIKAFPDVAITAKNYLSRVGNGL